MSHSKLPANIFRKVVGRIDDRRAFVLATILESDGSTPRKTATRAVIEPDGTIVGTIGGGHVEAETQRRAVRACESGQPQVIKIGLHGQNSADHEPICGGAVRVLIDPTAAKDRTAYDQAATALEQRRQGLLLTRVRCSGQTTTAVEWFGAERIASTEAPPGPRALSEALEHERARLLAPGLQGGPRREQILVEPVVPAPRLLIVGAGHIGQALARQAQAVGFELTVLDDRPDLTEPALFPPGTATRCGDIAEAVSAFDVEPDTYIVIVTRGHTHDAEALRACIGRPAAYIGMIGSKRKVALVRRDFIESGLATPEQFDRVFAPIGLDIGSVTVGEIAASIVAELVAVRRKGLAWAIASRKARL